MAITERQNLILNKIIEDYIKSAKPVASQSLKEKYDFDISPATIRIEMQKLTDQGYLYQPHTSAGRIPTDKGYRVLVNKLLEKDFSKSGREFFHLDGWKKIRDDLILIREITKALAEASSNLALGYIFEKDFLWKEGWPEILHEPEFNKSEFTLKFARTIDYFEKNIASLFQIFPRCIQIYIGEENIFPQANDFSTIISKCRLPENTQGIFAILGPKRMAYSKNINLINSIVKLLEKY